MGDEQGFRSRVYDILPPPFEWRAIPAGKVTLEAGGYVPEGGQTFDVPAFEIAKYPVTNAQFARFIAAGGYTQKKWWTDAGWDARDKQQWAEPRFWQDAQWNGANYPVVGVSWYEAIAFCAWLNETSGENIVLPTEQEWQRAAQGDDGRLYPWGNEWDCERCQNSVSPCESKHTSEVTQYDGKGDSPYGVCDMAGNVWEWCQNAFETGALASEGTETRVMRGSAWFYDNAERFRAAVRFWYRPVSGFNYGGFRLAQS